MSTFEEDRRKEKKVEVLLLYFKQLLIEYVSYGKSDSTFKALGGDKVGQQVMQGAKEGLISLDKDSLELIRELDNCFTELVESKSSVSKAYDREFNDVTWLSDLDAMMDIDAYTTPALELLKSMKYEVKNEFNRNEKDPTLPTLKEYGMQKHIKHIKELSKKRKNS